MQEQGGGEHPVSAARIGALRGEVRQRIPQAKKILTKSGLEGKDLNRAAINVAGETYLTDLKHKKVEKKLQKEKEQAEEKARIDSLTGLPNRNGLADRVEQMLAQFRRDKITFAIKTGDKISDPYKMVFAFLDLRGLKEINDLSEDTHTTGDIYLQEAAGILRASSRETDTVARVGGDEFVVILPKSTIEEAKESWWPKVYELSEKMGKKFVVGLAEIDPNDWKTSFIQADQAQGVAKAKSNEAFLTTRTKESELLTYNQAMQILEKDPNYLRFNKIVR